VYRVVPLYPRRAFNIRHSSQIRSENHDERRDQLTRPVVEVVAISSKATRPRILKGLTIRNVFVVNIYEVELAGDVDCVIVKKRREIDRRAPPVYPSPNNFQSKTFVKHYRAVPNGTFRGDGPSCKLITTKISNARQFVYDRVYPSTVSRQLYYFWTSRSYPSYTVGDGFKMELENVFIIFCIYRTARLSIRTFIYFPAQVYIIQPDILRV